MALLEELKALPRGTKLRIRAGAPIRSTKNYREVIINKRTRVVNLYRVESGWDCYISHIVGDRDNHAKAIEMGYDLKELAALCDTDPDKFYKGKLTLRKPQVIWSGTGRYWHETPIENVL